MKSYVPIGMAILVAGLAVPAALGQQAHAPLDNMPIFGMPSTRSTQGVPTMESGTFSIPDGYLGIETQDIAGSRAGAVGAHGVKVTQVDLGSPAAQAGFKIGDVVLDYNGQAVEANAQLSRLVNETPAGRTVKIGVSRAGARLTLTPTVIEHHPDVPVLISKVQPELTPEARKAGIEGAVSVYAEIGTDGRVHHARVVKGLGYGLDDKAMEAVAQWRFTPGRKNGVPVTIPATIEVWFRRQQ
jgi:TonB family protein